MNVSHGREYGGRLVIYVEASNGATFALTPDEAGKLIRDVSEHLGYVTIKNSAPERQSDE